MASTIQIKRGTGSAVPSGLLDGELAINLDSGKLYYGSGSNSVNSYTVTNITASGDISSSGTITANIIVSTGTDIELTNVSSPQITIKDTTNNNTLVLEQDNTRSHIRFDDAASNDLHFDSNADNNHLVLDSGNGNSGFGTQVYNKTSKVTVAGDIFASGSGGHITASSNISSSGHVIASRVYPGGPDAQFITTANGQIQSSTGFSGIHITASGNISASGDLIGKDLTLSGDLKLLDDTNDFFTTIEQGNSFHIDASHHAAMNIAISTNKFDNTATSVDTTATTANAHIFLDGGTGETVIKGTPIYFGNNTDASTAVFNGHITASANISASGALISSVVSSSIYRGGIRPLDQSVQLVTGSLAQGDIYHAETGVTTVPGKIYALLGNGNQVVADKDSELHSNSLLGVAIGTNSGTDGYLLRGMVKLHTNPFPGENALGSHAYLGDDGLATGSIAGHASDDFIRIIGYGISGSGTVYYDPDKTFIKKA